MILQKPKFELLLNNEIGYSEFIEYVAKTCYKSDTTDDEEKRSRFIRNLIAKDHTAVKFICDRGVSHELVRHRLASFAQESTRYCNYKKKGIVMIIPPWVNLEEGEYKLGQALNSNTNYDSQLWLGAMLQAESYYNDLIEEGWTPQQARAVLPNSLKTEVVVTANLREWRQIFKLRCAPEAHPQMRELMIPLLERLYDQAPDFFFDIYSQYVGEEDERVTREKESI